MTDTLYAARAGPSTSSALYTTNPATGALTSVGASGFAITGLAFDGTTMFGVTSPNSAANPKSLISLNLATGAGTLIAALSGFGGTIADVACNSSGVLYGLSNNGNLYTINKTTGVCALVGATGLGGIFGCAISFDSGDVLWSIPQGSQGNLYTINTSTGAATIGPAITGWPLNIASPACAFDAGDILYALFPTFGSIYHLVTVNTSTGATIDKGSTAFTDTDALEWDLASFGAATKVGFVAQPTDACNDLAPVQVAVQDAGGNTVTSSTAAVTVAIGTNPGGGTLTGTLTVNAVAGIATFSDLSIDAPGVGYTLVASSSGLTSATSGAFDVLGDPCTGAPVLSGVSGSFTDDNTGACTASPDALAAWFGTTVAHTLFYKYTAPVDGYIEFTISAPGGSTIVKPAAGVEDGPCGAMAVVTDPLLGQEALRNTAFPFVVGRPVTAGQTVYLEVAEDLLAAGHSSGAFTVTWALRQIIYFDEFDDTALVGPSFAVADPGGFGSVSSYARTTDGKHWVGWFGSTDGGATRDVHVGRLAADGSGSWDDWLVASLANNVIAENDHIFGGGGFVVTDGTDVWLAVPYSRGTNINTDDETISFSVFHFNGSTWDLLSDLTSKAFTTLGFNDDVNLNGSYHFTADPSEPGAMYLQYSEQGATAGRLLLARFTTSALDWETDAILELTPVGVVTDKALVRNVYGTPVLFYGRPDDLVDSGGGVLIVPGYHTVEMHSIDPATGALTLLQAVTGTDRRGSTPDIGTTPSIVNWISVLDAPWTDPIDSTPIYYLAVVWLVTVSTNLNWEGNVYRVPSDGAAAFGDFDLDAAKTVFVISSSPVAVGPQNFAEADDVWMQRRSSADIEQYDRICFNDWSLPTAPSASGIAPAPPEPTFASLDASAKNGDDFYTAYNQQTNPGGILTDNIGVVRYSFSRNAFCELGPTIILAAGPTLDGHFRV